jgi:alkyldihydroxyacetonephosphate synthase
VSQDTHNPTRTGRIYPEAPPPKREADLSPDVWGYRDSGFEMTPGGEVSFRGDRYPLSGTILPDLLPWAGEVLGCEIDPHDLNTSAYPPAIPEPRRNGGFLEAIGAALSPGQIVEDAPVRLRHGHGMTQEEMWAIKYASLPRVPDLVLYPTSDEHVEAIVRAAGDHDVCLVPYGGGTNVTDALRCPAAESRTIVSVDMGRMNRVLWIDAENRLACIEAGATGVEIGEQLARHGFTMGHEPDSYELSTLGGWVATNASGMKKNRYGNIEDLVLSARVVTPSGVLDRDAVAPRESIGGDPARWLLGSEGRLGLITRCVVKIFPLPAAQSHGSVLFKCFEDGFEFMRDVQRSGQIPASIRLMDNLQFQFGQALKPKKEGLAVLMSRLEKLYVLKLKGFEADKMVACTLLFEGSAEEVAAQEKTVYALAARHGGMKAGSENGERGYQLTFAIAYIRDFMMDHHILAESFETSVPWSQALALCQNVKQRVWQEHAKRGLPGIPFITCRVTQLYDTGVAIYFYFAFHSKDVENASQVYGELEHIAREEILASGGSLSHHHGVGKLRQPFLGDILSETALEWRRRLTEAVDPKNIFGCGN